MTFESTYSWIFASLALGFRGLPVGLREIVGAADYIDHAIPNRDELQTSLGWLIARGLVEKVDAKYSLTPTGSELYASFSAKSAYMHKMRPLIEVHFATLESESEAELFDDETINAILAPYSGK